MNELETLDEIFGAPKWKNKYRVKWCELCNTAMISCLEEDCHGSTCNCGGCDKCREDFKEFDTYKTRVSEYLSKEEKKIYDKCIRLKHFILETIPQGDKEINWKKLQNEGNLSQNDEEMFEDELFMANL